MNASEKNNSLDIKKILKIRKITENKRGQNVKQIKIT